MGEKDRACLPLTAGLRPPMRAAGIERQPAGHMSEPATGFVALALTKSVVARAVRVALLVGTILALINHGDALVRLAFDTNNVMKILLTYLVPYGVSTYSSVRAIQAQRRRGGRAV